MHRRPGAAIEPRIFRFKQYDMLKSLYDDSRRAKPTQAQVQAKETALRNEAELKRKRYVVTYLAFDSTAT